MARKPSKADLRKQALEAMKDEVLSTLGIIRSRRTDACWESAVVSVWYERSVAPWDHLSPQRHLGMRMQEKYENPEIYMDLSNDPYPRPAKPDDAV